MFKIKFQKSKVKSETVNGRRATGNRQGATGNTRVATGNGQAATCNKQPKSVKVKGQTGNSQPAKAACNAQRTGENRQWQAAVKK